MTPHHEKTSMIVEGWTPLYGCVRLWGAKNSSFKLMIAALLGKEKTRLLNLPNISEVGFAMELINHLGGSAKAIGNKTVSIDTHGLNSWEIPAEFWPKSRSWVMYMGPLLAKFGKAKMPMPGGDKIGERPINRTLQCIESMWATYDFVDDFLVMEAPNGLQWVTYRFDKNSHTGTEMLIMAAVLAEGKTILENAAMEPEIDDMIVFLNKMGAKIRRRAFRVIEIEGVKELTGCIHSVMPDRNEAVTYACAALLSKGDIIIENARYQDLTAFIEKVDEAGGGIEIDDFGIRFYYKWPLRATDIQTGPEPEFMTDWQALWAVLMCSAEGVSTIHECVYPNRFRQYTNILGPMGATFELFNPEVENPEKIYNFYMENTKTEDRHACKIHGGVKFKGGEFTIDDLRAGASTLLAAISGEGTTIIHNVEQIDRGYEDLDGKLIQMGAKIRRV